MNNYSYQIDPRPTDLGGGWRLRLFENGEEVGGGAFPLAEYIDAKDPVSCAYEDAIIEALDWLESK